MEIKSSCLVIADISGYTRFLVLHTTSVLHAETIISDLLEAVIAQAEYPLTVAKLEGDAVFLYTTTEGDQQAAARDVLKQVTGFFEAFRARERALIACNVCRCPACRSIDKLRLKVILHHGEVAIKQIRQFVELGGDSVILLHRLLKNSVSAKEYILMTRRFYELSGGLVGEHFETRTEHADGIGDVEVQVYYPPENSALPLPPSEPVLKPGTESAILYERMNDHADRRLSGVEPGRKFSSLPKIKVNLWHRLDFAIGRLIPQIIVGLQSIFRKKT